MAARMAPATPALRQAQGRCFDRLSTNGREGAGLPNGRENAGFPNGREYAGLPCA
jgi:hypothetical protein